MNTLDLSTAIMAYNAHYDATTHAITGTAATGACFFYFPSLAVDPAASGPYTFEVDVTYDAAKPTTAGINSLRTNNDIYNSQAYLLGQATATSGTGSGTQTQTLTITIGPGINSWASGMAAGETHLEFEGPNSTASITAIRYTAPTPPTPPLGTDTTVGSYGYSYAGSGVLDYDPPVVPTPAHLSRAHVRRVSRSLPTPTLTDGSPR